MNKIFTRVIGGALGLAMAVGIGVSLSSNRVFSKTDAAVSTYTWAPTSKLDVDENNKITVNTVEWKQTTGNAQGYQKDYAGIQYGTSSKADGVTLETTSDFVYNSKSLIKKITIYANTGGSATITASVGNTMVISSTSVTKKGSLNGDYTKASKHEYTSTDGITGKISFTITGSSKGCYFCGIVIEVDENTTPAVPVTVSINGSLNKTSYAKTDSWSHDGLVASGVYGENAEYTGDFSWTFSPSSPSDLEVGPNQDLTITATVSSVGYSGSISKVVKINITATPTSGIADGGRYIIVANGNKYFNGTISSGKGQLSSNKYEGKVFAFNLVDDYTYTINNGTDFIGIGSTSTSMSYSTSSNGLEITKSGNYYKITGSSGRYLCYYSDASDIRTYSSNTSYITLLTYNADEVASEIKTLAGGWNNKVETADCGDHYQLGKARVLELSPSELEVFQTSTDTEIANARTTYEWWCSVNGDNTPYSGPIVQNSRISGNWTLKSISI